MPLYKYVANRSLTLLQNLLLDVKLSEFHTGFRAFSRRTLETLPLLANSNDFVFDNQMLVQAIHFGYRMAEITCPTVYSPESSSISLKRSIKYGLGVLGTSMQCFLHRWGLKRSRFLEIDGRRLEIETPEVTEVAETAETIEAEEPVSVEAREKEAVAARPLRQWQRFQVAHLLRRTHCRFLPYFPPILVP